MRRTVWIAVAIAIVVVLAGVRSTRADVDARTEEMGSRCSDRTLKGTYGIQLQGTRPSSPGGPIESVVGVVIRTYDGRGAFTQIDNVKGSISGTVPDREGNGTYEVNSDCTATTHIEPGPGIMIEERLVIVDGGREVFSATMQPPPVMVTAVHRRIR